MDTPIRGRTRPLPIKTEEVKKIDANLNAKIHNRFDIEVVDAKTGKIKQRAQAENVICSALWTRLLTPNTYFNYIHYGTGTGTPAATDTSLFTFLGYGTPVVADDVITNTPATGIYAFRRKITISESTAVGKTLTEVGIGYSTTAATLCTHAMLKDMNGNQISIAKTDTDIINVYATVFLHYSATGYNGARIVPRGAGEYGNWNNAQAGYPYSGTYFGFLPYLCGMYNSDCGKPPTLAHFLHGGYSESFTSQYATVTPSYNVSNKTITLTVTRLAADKNNISGIENIIFGPGYVFSFSIDPGGTWLNGTNVTGEAIGTGDGSTKDFTTAFPYASGGKVYINGTEQASGVSYTKDITASEMGYYFKPIDADSTPDNIIPTSAREHPVYINNNYLGKYTYYFYNPFYDIGIASLYLNPSATLFCSNDMNTWTSISTGTVPEAYRHYKFWKFVGTDECSQFSNIVSAGTGKSIHFDTAPVAGAVITADYHTNSIGKNSNYVFDLTLTLTLGEYTA